MTAQPILQKRFPAGAAISRRGQRAHVPFFYRRLRFSTTQSPVISHEIMRARNDR